MNSYYNPFTRLKMISEAWSRSERIALKLAEHRGAKIYSKTQKISIFFDYIGAFIAHGISLDQYEDYEVYMVKRCVRKGIMSNRRNLHFISAMNQKKQCKELENKVLFNKRFKEFVKRDWLYSEEMSQSDFTAFCEKHDKAIIKPIKLNKGIGIHVIDIPKEENAVLDLYNKLKNQDVLIEELIKQHDEMKFSRKSVNTVRMYTILDRDGEAHLIKAVLRIGAPDKDIDNYHAGGSIYTLCKEYGMVEIPGKTLVDTRPIYYLQPNNVKMLGFVVPNYDIAVDAVKRAAKVVPDVRYIGWDVAITPEGCELIEANHDADPNFHQLGYCDKNYYEKLKSMI
jgi:hypothetical protein